jgi:hypothetical protein
MQSGKARTREWVLDYEPEEPREIEPLMGWTASGDMRQQVRLRFDAAEEAIAYCERHGISAELVGFPEDFRTRDFSRWARRYRSV